MFSTDLKSCYWQYDGQKYSSSFMHRYFKFKDISSLIYGPQSYTFRAYKSQDLLDQFGPYDDNNPTLSTESKPDFFGWECITLKLRSRTVDFVIRDEIMIMKFIQAISVANYITSMKLSHPIEAHEH